ncbi:MAG: hypothetical protein KDA25_10730 [Phycisphaerales bacterium]|nr:hypothetical protein [Phycisphaerales bacterium]
MTDATTPPTRLDRPMPGPVMLGVRLLWPFLLLGLLLIPNEFFESRFGVLNVLLCIVPIAVIAIINALAQWRLLSRPVCVGRRRRLAFMLTGLAVLVPLLFLAGFVVLIIRYW